MNHRPLPDGAPLHDLVQCWGDVYTHTEHYSWEPFTEAVRVVLLKHRGQPESIVTLYRAVPAHEPAVLHTGDWVAISQDYAEHHRESQAPVGEPWVILSAQVPAAQVRNGGSDVLEWGYWGPDFPAHVGEPRTWHTP